MCHHKRKERHCAHLTGFLTHRLYEERGHSEMADGLSNTKLHIWEVTQQQTSSVAIQRWAETLTYCEKWLVKLHPFRLSISSRTMYIQTKVKGNKMNQSSSTLISHFLFSPAAHHSLIISVFIMLQRALVPLCVYVCALREKINLKAEVIVPVPATH